MSFWSINIGQVIIAFALTLIAVALFAVGSAIEEAMTKADFSIKHATREVNATCDRIYDRAASEGRSLFTRAVAEGHSLVNRLRPPQRFDDRWPSHNRPPPS